MKALILIGGQGTRLRPFTNDTPKPLLPIVNFPLLHYQLETLRRHKIREVVLCTSYQAETFHRAFPARSHAGLRIHFVHERSPLGTGGAVRNAQRYIDGTTLILNGDLLNALDITSFVHFHRKSGADVSISLTRVKDPTLYGLVETDESGKVRRFLEKPSWDDITCNTINAGAYLFEPNVIQFIPPAVAYSLERGLFPQLLEHKYRLMGYVTKGYWIDIGTIDKYLQVHLDLLADRTSFGLKGFVKTGGVFAGPGVALGRDISHEDPGKVAVGAKTKIGPYVRFSGSVSIGARCAVGQGAVLENCVVLEGSRIGEGARLDRCVVGRRCTVGPHASLGPGRALGDRSIVERFSQL